MYVCEVWTKYAEERNTCGGKIQDKWERKFNKELQRLHGKLNIILFVKG